MFPMLELGSNYRYVGSYIMKHFSKHFQSFVSEEKSFKKYMWNFLEKNNLIYIVFSVPAISIYF